MAAIELRRAGELAYREALPEGEAAGAIVVMVHGFPEGSLMWEPLMKRLAAEGRRCVAPDLYNLGDSEETGPATFERVLASFERFIDGLALDEVVIVVHDWGGFVGLHWAADHPEAIRGLVISDTGFFSDGRWHGLADTIRGPEGDELVAKLDRAGFGAMLNGTGSTFSEEEVDAYWRPFEEGRGRRATLDFYRSADFAKFAPQDSTLAQVQAPALILWGEKDPFATLAGAKRFNRELADPRMVVVEGAGHFVWEEERERCLDEVSAFLAS